MLRDIFRSINDVRVGDKFHRLQIVEFQERKNSYGYRSLWCECICDCGASHETEAVRLILEKSKSCGCLNSELVSKRNTIHGGAKAGKHEKLFRIWRCIKQRCGDKNAKNYYLYGGRGIKICDEWKNDYSKFREWGIKNGYRSNLQIDRINNDGDYEPSNCRFVTHTENARNKRNNHVITAFGESKCASAWAEDGRCNVGYVTLLGRINKGSGMKAQTKKIEAWFNRHKYLTTMQAYDMGITSFHRRMSDMKEKGWVFGKRWVNNGVTQYYQYWVVGKPV
jgi:hypothetical protein